MEGGIAYSLSDRARLIEMSSTWLVNEPKFYGDNSTDIIEHIRKVAEYDPEFVVQLAIYLRNFIGLRTAPSVLLTEVAYTNSRSPKPFVRQSTPFIVRRPDEAASVIAHAKSIAGDIGDSQSSGSLPSGLKRGLADTMLNFSEYQLQKWNSSRKEVKLRDVINIVHPKPKTKEQAELIKKLLDDKLETPATWNTIITKKNDPEQWNKALETMPYQACLMNLRNIVESNANIDKAIQIITDSEKIRNSKMLPFQFSAAYKANDNPRVLEAIAKAVEISTSNIQMIPGKTLIVIDSSGSMEGRPYDLACMLGAISKKICEESSVYLFASTVEEFHVSSMDSVMTNFNLLHSLMGKVGYGTETQEVFTKLIDEGKEFDRIILLSDMQTFDTCYKTPNQLFNRYRKTYSKNVRLYSVDLEGYGVTIFPEHDTGIMLLSGWSEKLLDYIPIAERLPGAAFQESKIIEYARGMK
jgi:60 kDa SS-A/Ro ribonucleoprotein